MKFESSSISLNLQTEAAETPVPIKYLNSFTVKQQVSRASKQARQLRVSSTPMMIVDGKYIIESKPDRQETLKVLDYVVELQKTSS